MPTVSRTSGLGTSAPAGRPTSLPEYFRGDPCSVDVRVSGAITKTWRGKGVVSKNNTPGPPAIYHSSEGLASVTAYATGNGVEQFVYVIGEGGAWKSKPGAANLKISVKGEGARVETEAFDSSTGFPPVKVAATFTC